MIINVLATFQLVDCKSIADLMDLQEKEEEEEDGQRQLARRSMKLIASSQKHRNTMAFAFAFALASTFASAGRIPRDFGLTWLHQLFR